MWRRHFHSGYPPVVLSVKRIISSAAYEDAAEKSPGLTFRRSLSRCLTVKTNVACQLRDYARTSELPGNYVRYTPMLLRCSTCTERVFREHSGGVLAPDAAR